jgi:hypothetical protein
MNERAVPPACREATYIYISGMNERAVPPACREATYIYKSCMNERAVPPVRLKRLHPSRVQQYEV